MKFAIVLYILIVFSMSASLAQSPQASPTPLPTPAIAASAAPASAPSAPVPAVVKDESMAPPVFIQDIVVQAKALPVVGPYIVKIGQGLLLVLTLLTALTTCVVSVLSALKGISGAAGLDAFGVKVQALQDSKFVYWLKYASLLFNAQKPVSTPQEAQAQTVVNS